MPVFLDKQDRHLVLTSYKVLYSSLTAANELLYLGDHVPIRLLLRMRLRYSGSPILYLVRNPFDRIASFYRDKFQKQPLRIGESDFEWQPCHRIFYAALGLNADDPDERIADRFLHTDFSSFVQLLPEHWEQDLHLHPQWHVRRVMFGAYSPFCLRPNRTYPIETELQAFWDDSELPPTRKNRTAQRERTQPYSPKSADIVSALYARDFKELGYASDPNRSRPLNDAPGSG